MNVKALTMGQPWATLLALGAKPLRPIAISGRRNRCIPPELVQRRLSRYLHPGTRSARFAALADRPGGGGAQTWAQR